MGPTRYGPASAGGGGGGGIPPWPPFDGFGVLGTIIIGNPADVNGDDMVDIFDLAMIAGNFGLREARGPANPAWSLLLLRYANRHTNQTLNEEGRQCLPEGSGAGLLPLSSS